MLYGSLSSLKLTSSTALAVLLLLAQAPSDSTPLTRPAITATDAPKADPLVDPRALALLERVQARMSVVHSLSALSRATITHGGTTTAPGGRSLTITTRLRLMRPNLTRADMVWLTRHAGSPPSQDRVAMTLAADGTTTWRLWDGTEELTTWPTDPAGGDSEKEMPGPLRGFFDRRLLPTAFLTEMEDQHLLRHLEYLGKRPGQGGPYRVVRLEYQKPGTSVVETDDYDIGTDLMVHHMADAWGDTRIQADLTALRIDPPMTRASFAFTPPPTARLHVPDPMPQDVGPAVGTPAPDFALAAADGRAIRLTDFRGKVVVLDFWATWCGNCVQEFPGEAALARKYADQGVVVLAVDVCDAPGVYRRWLARHSEYNALTFALDPQGIAGKGINTTLYKGASRPAQFVIDRSGLFAGAITGYDGDAKETALEAAIRKACAAR